MKKLPFVLIILSFAFSSTYSQSAAIGPQIGYYKTQDADNGSAMIGAALRLKLSDSFGVEGSINYRSEKFDGGNIKTTSYPIMATAMIYVLPIVYGAAGIGWYNVKYQYSDLYKTAGLTDETKQQVGYHFGAGAELGFGNIILTGDIRYVFLDLKFDKLPNSKSIKSNFYVMTAGVLFRL